MGTPIRTSKISHVVLNVADVERSVRFYTEVLGFKETDRNEQGMVFLRNGTDHHTLAFAPRSPEAAVSPLNHVALEVDRVDDLFAAREFLRNQGVEIIFEGRRGPGCNIGVEFKDPDGNTIELACEMEQVGWSGQARPHALHRRARSLEEAVANPVPAAPEPAAV